MLEKELTTYLRALALDRRASERTVEAYRRDLFPWVQFHQELLLRGGLSAPNDPLVLRMYLQKRMSEGAGNRSLARFLSALSGFQKHFANHPKLASFVFKLPKLKYAANLPQFLPQGETDRLTDPAQADKFDTHYAQMRNYCLVSLLYSTGARREEISRVLLSDLDLGIGIMRVHGKGNKLRTVPLGEAACADLKKYLALRREFAASKESTSPHLFLNRSGGPLGMRSVDRLVKTYGAQEGVMMTPHTLRHSYATHLLDNGADLLFIKETMGHASLSTTQKYTHVTAERMKRAYRTAHPRSGYTK